MRTVIVITAMALLAGCGGSAMMSSGASGTSDYGHDVNERDKIFNSWVGGS